MSDDNTQIGGIAAEALRQFVLRIEQLEAEIKGLNADKSEVFKQAKASGFDVKVIRALLAERRKEPHEVEEQTELLDLYRAAMNSADALTCARAREAAE